jgi:exopolysaccharide biosynthesis polyprenyl glycosylphosphotransferase
VNVFGVSINRRSLLFLVFDALFAVVAIMVAQAVRFGTADAVQPFALLSQYTGASALFFGAHVIALYVFEGYDASRDFRQRLSQFNVLVAVVVASIAQMALFYMFPAWWWGRGLLLLSNLAFGFGALTSRYVMTVARPVLTLRSRVLVVGAGPAAKRIVGVLVTDPGGGHAYEVLGLVDERDHGASLTQPSAARVVGPGGVPRTPTPLMPDRARVIGTSRDLVRIVSDQKVDLIVVATLGPLDPVLTANLLACKSTGVAIEDVRYTYERLLGKVPIEYLNEAAIIFGPSFVGASGPSAAIQRLLDIALSSVGLVLASPLLIGGIIAVKMDSPGPAFYVQERIGKGRVPFRMVKLRTMVPNAEARTGPVWSKGGDDPRVTRVGRFLRRSRIDEVPQLWNVLRGDMSIVGPRPEREPFVSQLASSIPFYALRFAVPPGVTGWAQVKYRYGASEEDAAEKLRYELYAIQSMNPVLYLLILIKTVQTVVMKAGS